MKKIVSVLLAITLLSVMLCQVAFADTDTSSKTTEDLIVFKNTVEFPPAPSGSFLRPVQSDEEGYQNLLAISDSELEKLSKASSYSDYFGDVVDENNNPVNISEMIGTEDYHVYEFLPIIAGGYTPENGRVTVKMLFPTPYKVGQKVVVLVGRVSGSDADRTVNWTAFSGKGIQAPSGSKSGAVQVTLDPDTVQYIENGTALIAVVSK